MRLRIPNVQSAYGFERLAQTRRLLQISSHIQRFGHIVLQQEKSCFNGKPVDRPRHTVGAQPLQQTGAARYISKPQTGNRIPFRHGMQQQYIRILRRLCRREKRTQRKELIRLVYNKTNLRIMFNQSAHIFFTGHRSRGIVGVAEPQHPHIVRQAIPVLLLRQLIKRTHPVSVHTAGIRIFAESGLQDSCIRTPESLCNKVYGLRCAIRYANSSGRQLTAGSHTGFQRIGFGFGVIAYLPDTFAKMNFQTGKIHFVVHVGTEICRYRAAVFIGIVSVSVNHILSDFNCCPSISCK